MKATITKLKNTLEGINGRLNDTEENGSASWKTEQQKSLTLNRKKKKNK